MKTAFLCFGCIVFTSLFISIVLSPFSLPIIVKQLILYSGFFIVLVVFLLKTPAIKKTDFNFRMKPINVAIVPVIALVCIGSYMLLQGVFVDIFNKIGLDADMDSIKIGALDYVLYTFTICIIPAFIEELLFRGIIYKSLQADKLINKRVWVYIILSAFLFAVFHLSFAQLVYQFIMGIIFASIFYKTGNILYSILAHFINNFFIITYTFIAGTDYIAYTWNWYTILAAIFSALVGSAIIYFLVVKCLKKEQNAK